MADSEAATGLYSLPTPLVSHVMALCDARGACALAQTCTAMRVALDDAVWAAHCARVPFFKAVQGVPYRCLYLLAHLWNGWPLGWWWCTSRLPGGHVQDITLQLLRGEYRLVITSWGTLSPEGGDSYVQSIPLGSLEELTGPNAAEELTLAKAVVQLAGHSVLHLRWALGQPDFVYERIPGEYAPCGLGLPTAVEPPGCLAGIHSSYYGSHGVEYVLLRATDRQQAVSGSSALPAQLASGGGHILTGLKLKGDPNVPSGQLTFAADLEVVELPRRQGAVQPWDSYDNDGNPNPAATVDDRAVVFFGRHMMVQLRLEERLEHVLCVYPRVWGQINAVPGEWAPQWVRACVIVYRPGTVMTMRAGHRVGPTPVAFTLLWNDDLDREWRHAMDFCMVAHAC